MEEVYDATAVAKSRVEEIKRLLGEAKNDSEHLNVNYDNILNWDKFVQATEGRSLFLWEYLLKEVPVIEEAPYETRVECVLDIIKELRGSSLPVFKLPLFSRLISNVINDDDNKVNRDVAMEVYFFLYRYYREVKEIPNSFINNDTSIVQDLQDFVWLTGEAYNTDYTLENIEEVFNGNYLDMVGASITLKMHDTHKGITYTALQHGLAIKAVLSCIVFDSTKINPKASQMSYKESIELVNLALRALQKIDSLPEQSTDKLKGISTDFRAVD